MEHPTGTSRFMHRFRMGVTTEQQREDFLELVASGWRVDAAALEVGHTASRFRTLARSDPEFAEAYKLAKEERNRAHRGKIRKRLDEIAFSQEQNSFAALRLQAEMYLPELEHKRSKVIRHGNEGEAFRIQAVLPTVTQEALDAMPLEELKDLVAKMEALTNNDVAQLRALPGGHE